MFAVDNILPTDNASLYEAVASGDTIKVVHSYAKALRHAFSAVSNRKNRAEKSVAEEKVDEFFANYSGSPQSTSSSSCKPASYSQPLSFSLGNYCWQHLLQTSLPSSNIKDISCVQVQEVDAIIDECLSQTNMNKYEILPNDFYPASKTIKQYPLQQSNLLRSAHMQEEDVKSLARVLSNSRPPPSFIHSEPPRTSNVMESALPHQVLFDGSHGPTNGSLTHLACIVDSPLILAALLAFGGDPGCRHTAFRRLPIHEAACNGSKDCLTLLLEISRTVEEAQGHCTDSTTSTTSFYLGWSLMTTVAPEDSKLPRSGYEKESSTQSPDENLYLADTIVSRRIPFLSALRLMLELNNKVNVGLMSELQAAREMLRILGIPQSVRTSFISAIPLSSAIDGHGNTALHWASFKSKCECVSILLKSGADSNFRSNHFGWTPLHDAAYSDSAEVVKLLIGEGADINARSNSGATPLCFAAQEDAPHAAELLLQAGANAAAQCNGQQPIYTGSSTGVNTARIPYTPSRFSGYTPLHYCAHYNSVKVSKVLIQYGAPMEIEDFSGRRPIHVAVARGSSDVLRELLYAGTKVETSIVGADPAVAGCMASSAPSRLESQFISPNSQVVESLIDSTHLLPQGRFMMNSSSPLTLEVTARQRIMPGQLSPPSAEAAPVSSPVLKSMIPSRPVHSSKPWNCLTQQAIDECKYLLSAAEGHWSPLTHKIFSPTDRRAIFELLKVGKRMEQRNTGYFLELWPEVLSYCGRGWFDPVAQVRGSCCVSQSEGKIEENCTLQDSHNAGSLSEENLDTFIDDSSIHDEDEDVDFTQFHLESDEINEVK